eukprot:GEMP01003797.1.p1 GENE.GEMP01003797.1~~GEMP01003797.1.p1  ORF type:complete len:1247 (+),score=355.77 GEMP01003797.1:234-3974(+)
MPLRRDNDVKRKLVHSLSRLASEDTGLPHDIQEIIRTLEHVPEVIQMVEQNMEEIKPVGRRMCVGILGAICEIHGEDVFSWLPKILTIIVQRFGSADTHLRDALCDTLSRISSAYTPHGPQHLMTILKPLFQAISACHDKFGQQGTAMGVSAVLSGADRTAVQTNLLRVLPKIAHLIGLPLIQCRVALLNAVMVLLQAAPDEFEPGGSAISMVLPLFDTCCRDPEWQTRYKIIEVGIMLGDGTKDYAAKHKLNADDGAWRGTPLQKHVLKYLIPLGEDKVRQVRDAVKHLKMEWEIQDAFGKERKSAVKEVVKLHFEPSARRDGSPIAAAAKRKDAVKPMRERHGNVLAGKALDNPKSKAKVAIAKRLSIFSKANENFFKPPSVDDLNLTTNFIVDVVDDNDSAPLDRTPQPSDDGLPPHASSSAKDVAEDDLLDDTLVDCIKGVHQPATAYDAHDDARAAVTNAAHTMVLDVDNNASGERDMDTTCSRPKPRKNDVEVWHDRHVECTREPGTQGIFDAPTSQRPKGKSQSATSPKGGGTDNGGDTWGNTYTVGTADESWDQGMQTSVTRAVGSSSSPSAREPPTIGSPHGFRAVALEEVFTSKNRLPRSPMSAQRTSGAQPRFSRGECRWDNGEHSLPQNGTTRVSASYSQGEGDAHFDRSQMLDQRRQIEKRRITGEPLIHPHAYHHPRAHPTGDRGRHYIRADGVSAAEAGNAPPREAQRLEQPPRTFPVGATDDTVAALAHVVNCVQEDVQHLRADVNTVLTRITDLPSLRVEVTTLQDMLHVQQQIAREQQLNSEDATVASLAGDIADVRSEMQNISAMVTALRSSWRHGFEELRAEAQDMREHYILLERKQDDHNARMEKLLVQVMAQNEREQKRGVDAGSGAGAALLAESSEDEVSIVGFTGRGGATHSERNGEVSSSDPPFTLNAHGGDCDPERVLSDGDASPQWAMGRIKLSNADGHWDGAGDDDAEEQDSSPYGHYQEDDDSLENELVEGEDEREDVECEVLDADEEDEEQEEVGMEEDEREDEEQEEVEMEEEEEVLEEDAEAFDEEDEGKIVVRGNYSVGNGQVQGLGGVDECGRVRLGYADIHRNRVQVLPRWGTFASSMELDPPKDDHFITTLLDLCASGEYLDAYKRALAASDLNVLVNLMLETGPSVTEFLDAETNSRMIRRLIHILQSSATISLDVILQWLLSVVDQRIHFTASQIDDLTCVLKLRAMATPDDGISSLLSRLNDLKVPM